MAGRRGAARAGQANLDFSSVLKQAEVRTRDAIIGEAESPVERTAAYMQRALAIERAWETTIHRARQELLTVDPRELYLDLFKGLKKKIEAGERPALLAHLLEDVAHRGFGMGPQHLQVLRPTRSRSNWGVRVEDWTTIEAHLEEHIVGDTFLLKLDATAADWAGATPLIGASDVSQHRSLVPVPARFFKRTVPFVLNNAAGVLLDYSTGQPRYEPLFNPSPQFDEQALRWMLLDPSYQDELEVEDYLRATASAMDVGQYYFDAEYLLSNDRPQPNVILRDGSLFPQDAYLSNYLIENRRGDFTREAIQGLLNCLQRAEKARTLYCGVAKNVRLKVYSAALDWYINQRIDASWELGAYTVNDGEAMSLLLASPELVGPELMSTVSTCLIKRSFTTRANLNTRVRLDNGLDHYFRQEQEKESTEHSIDPYRDLCYIGHLHIFFAGHSKTPQQRLPRYEFFTYDALGPPLAAAAKVFDAVRRTGLQLDKDQGIAAEETISYLLPSVTRQAQQYSKDVIRHIDRATGAGIMARYKRMMQQGTSKK